MGVINANNQVSFVEADDIVNRVRRRLKSFDAVDNIIRDEDVYDSIRLIISRLGCGMYEESKAVITIDKHKGDLPPNFESPYAAYSCACTHPRPVHYHQQGRPALYFQSICSDVVGIPENGTHCDIRCPEVLRPMCRIIVTNYVAENPCDQYEYTMHKRMRIVNQLSAPCYADGDCLHPLYQGDHVLQINKQQKTVGVNFKQGAIYLEYWGFPLGPEGLPRVIEDGVIEDAVVKSAVYEVLRDAWFNADVPDLQNKMQKAEADAKSAFEEANYQVKLPSFAGMLEMIRNQQIRRFARFERLIH